MTDLDKLMDQARDWNSRRGQLSGSLASLRKYDAEGAQLLRKLTAALDAARGEAVAWCHPEYLEDVREDGYANILAHASPKEGQNRIPLFAAPPALQAELDHARRRIGELTIQLGEAMKAPPAALAVPAVDDLAQIIRAVDGRHSLGAGALAEKIVEALAQQPAALAVPAEEAIEAAYWDFDARHKGYGPHKTTPQSERDAFKWAARSLLAAPAQQPSAAVPEGYALVPVEPTDDMVWAGKSAFATAYNAMHKGERRSPVSETWAAMLAAERKGES